VILNSRGHQGATRQDKGAARQDWAARSSALHNNISMIFFNINNCCFHTCLSQIIFIFCYVITTRKQLKYLFVYFFLFYITTLQFQCYSRHCVLLKNCACDSHCLPSSLLSTSLLSATELSSSVTVGVS
jgi:hypothetical protein